MSSNISSFFDDPRESLKWGREGVEEIDVACRAFFKTAAHSFYTEVDAETGQHIKKFKILDPIPRNIVKCTTETLHHIRYSFDQAFFGACRALRGERAKLVIFPWATDADDLENRLKNKKFSPELLPIFRSFKPYGRGQKRFASDQDIVRALAQIAGRKKHTVHLAACPSIHHVQYPSLRGKLTGSISFPQPTWDPVNQEIILVRYMPSSDVKNDAHVAMEVGFNEAPPLSGESVVGCLDIFADKADAVIEGFERECRQILTTSGDH